MLECVPVAEEFEYGRELVDLLLCLPCVELLKDQKAVIRQLTFPESYKQLTSAGRLPSYTFQANVESFMTRTICVAVISKGSNSRFCNHRSTWLYVKPVSQRRGH